MAKWKVAAYPRLSSDDDDKDLNGKDESNSITNQKQLIKDFIKKNKDMELIDFYTDDGFTGTDFERPGYKRMLNDIRDGKVNTVFVKDLSRLGRNYAKVGSFIEDIVPLYNLRFISINENVDSFLKPESIKSLEIPIKNIMNDEYARDISKKVRSTLKTKKEGGDYIGVMAPYGYLKDPDDKYKFIIDEEAAKVVKKIFNLALKGKTKQEIADYLNYNNYLPPSLYLKTKYDYSIGNLSKRWSSKIIGNILKNQTYIGYLVQGKNYRASYKLHTILRKSEDDWIIIENHHKAIIDKEVFFKVNNLFFERNAKSNHKGKYNLYAGHLKCIDCNATMTRCSKTYKGEKKGYYYCGSYKYKKICSKHYIPEKDLNELVLVIINIYCNLMCSVKDCIEKVVSSKNIDYSFKLKEIRNMNLDEELKKYNMLLSEVNKDYELNYISEEDFLNYSNDYIIKIRDLESQKNELKQLNNSANLDWIDKFIERESIDSLNKVVIDELIDCIYINEIGTVIINFNYMNEFEEAIHLLKLGYI